MRPQSVISRDFVFHFKGILAAYRLPFGRGQDPRHDRLPGCVRGELDSPSPASAKVRLRLGALCDGSLWTNSEVADGSAKLPLTGANRPCPVHTVVSSQRIAVLSRPPDGLRRGASRTRSCRACTAG